MKVISRGRAYKRGADFSRLRQNFQGAPSNYISSAVVGHYDSTPTFARIENNKVLVEVTLLPSGDEIIAELQDQGGGGGFALYMPVQIGMRVLVAMPQGEDDTATIIAKLTDNTWPMPDDVAGITASEGEETTPAPQFAFLRTPDGALLAVEAGDGGDIIVRSGASLKLETPPGGQTVVHSTETHLGADFQAQPEGAMVGKSGEIVPGTPAEKYVPASGSNKISAIPLAPPTPPINPLTSKAYPADGLVRFKDGTQINTDTDKAFTDYLLYLFVWTTAANGVLDTLTGSSWSGTLNLALAAAGASVPLVPPTSVNGAHKSSSRSTAAD